MENILNYKGNMCENCTKCGVCLDFGDYELIEEIKKDFNGNIFVISYGKFKKGLIVNEYLVYYTFLGMSRHDNNRQYYIYKNDLNFSQFEQDLRLSVRYDNVIIPRKTMNYIVLIL